MGIILLWRYDPRCELFGSSASSDDAGRSFDAAWSCIRTVERAYSASSSRCGLLTAVGPGGGCQTALLGAQLHTLQMGRHAALPNNDVGLGARLVAGMQYLRQAVKSLCRISLRNLDKRKQLEVLASMTVCICSSISCLVSSSTT